MKSPQQIRADQSLALTSYTSDVYTAIEAELIRNYRGERLSIFLVLPHVADPAPAFGRICERAAKAGWHLTIESVTATGEQMKVTIEELPNFHNKKRKAND